MKAGSRISAIGFDIAGGETLWELKAPGLL